jgi:hypothetical protein
MAHLVPRPGEAESRWPDRLERIAAPVRAATGPATIRKAGLISLTRTATNDVETRYCRTRS